MQMKNDTMMFGKEGKCVEIITVKCDIEFESINNQIEFEEMKRNFER